MKTRRGMLSVVTLAASVVGALALAKLTSPTPPRVSTAELVEIGVQGRGTVSIVRLPIRNIGGETLELSRIKSSCGCIAIQDEKDRPLDATVPFRIPPYSERALIARFGIKEIPGERFRGTIDFTSNDPICPETQIEIVAEVQGHLRAMPAEVLLWDLNRKAIVQREIALIDTGRFEKAKVARVESSNSKILSVKLVSGESAAARNPNSLGIELKRIQLEFVSPDHECEIQEQIRVFAESDEQPLMTIPVRAKVVSTIQILPRSITLPIVVGGKVTNSARSIFRRTDKRPFELSVLHAPSQIKVTISKDDPGQAYLVTVEFIPEEASKSLREKMVVRLRAVCDSVSEQLELPVTYLNDNLIGQK
jgi:hypothetical protein